MSKSFETAGQRVDALIRIVALFCIILGGVFLFFISQTVLIPQLVPIFYFMATLLIFAGIVLLIVKFE
jgi:hypothetical protein